MTAEGRPIVATLPRTPVDEILATTRAVRRRLDLTRPVERALVEECLELAVQAPSGSNRQPWQFVVVTDPARRLALADLYRLAWADYMASPAFVGRAPSGDAATDATNRRVAASAQYLADHLHEVPVMLVPCIAVAEGEPTWRRHAGTLGSILPATWSFMLAARARGLGTCWTTMHLAHEEAAATVLGIPYPAVRQAALIPVAHALGDSFKPAPRQPLDRVVHWDAWHGR
jgi:nitroreductase